MSAVCMLAAGAIVATLHTREFVVEWRHSIEKTRWEERYRIDGARLMLTSASIEGMGAGMEPPPEARLEGDRWTWHPDRALDDLRLTQSPYARDYTICWDRRCAPLSVLIGQHDVGVVRLQVC